MFLICKSGVGVEAYVVGAKLPTYEEGVGLLSLLTTVTHS